MVDPPGYYEQGSFVAVDLQIPEVRAAARRKQGQIGDRGRLPARSLRGLATILSSMRAESRWSSIAGRALHGHPPGRAPATHAPPLSAPQPPAAYNQWQENEDMVALHLAALAAQLQQAYVGWALAVAANRTFILPKARRGRGRHGTEDAAIDLAPCSTDIVHT